MTKLVRHGVLQGLAGRGVGDDVEVGRGNSEVGIAAGGDCSRRRPRQGARGIVVWYQTQESVSRPLRQPPAGRTISPCPISRSRTIGEFLAACSTLRRHGAHDHESQRRRKRVDTFLRRIAADHGLNRSVSWGLPSIAVASPTGRRCNGPSRQVRNALANATGVARTYLLCRLKFWLLPERHRCPDARTRSSTGSTSMRAGRS